MKYLRTYVGEWDELCQIEFGDDDPSLAKIPPELLRDLSDTPHVGLPIRPRSRAEADKQRQAEAAAREQS